MNRVERGMSSDTAKENASVVDSSLTDWKQDIGNSDDPGKFVKHVSLFDLFLFFFIHRDLRLSCCNCACQNNVDREFKLQKQGRS